ncbi:MAG: alpha/beta hydrolase [Bdellovibrionales bacterium]|nr:alpha/beta hydrolase [Bdellovibrionales bacterium]
MDACPSLVVFVHGMERVRLFLGPLARRFREEGFHTPFFSYSPRRNNVSQCAELLVDYLRERDSSVSIVCFSLGGVICAEMIGTYQEFAMNAVHRVVFLGSPINGSELAKKVSRIPGSGLIFGKCFLDLANSQEFLPQSSATVGMIAGKSSFARVCNPFLKEENDILVQLRETQSEALTEHVSVDTNHWALPLRKDAHDLCIRFIKTGSFIDQSTESTL